MVSLLKSKIFANNSQYVQGSIVLERPRFECFPTGNLSSLTYFVSSVLRNISCMVVLSLALGAIFSNDTELKATLLPLFTATRDNKEPQLGGSHYALGFLT